MRRRLCLLTLALALAGCGAHESEKRYRMQGEVKGLDPANKLATVAAGKIEGWMDAMTMEFQVKPDAEFAKLHNGDHIEAAVVVQGEKYYLTDVKVTPRQ